MTSGPSFLLKPQSKTTAMNDWRLRRGVFTGRERQIASLGPLGPRSWTWAPRLVTRRDRVWCRPAVASAGAPPLEDRGMAGWDGLAHSNSGRSV